MADIGGSVYQSLNINFGGPPKVPNGLYHAPGMKYYIKDGRKHRLNGPAVIKTDGYEAWYFEGELHREGGPAVRYPDGREEYWERGKKVR